MITFEPFWETLRRKGIGFGVADDYVYCPHCGAELDWRHVRMLTERFRKLAERL
jgi:hypothetical protein